MSTAVALLPSADGAASRLSSGGWADNLPSSAAGPNCGGGLDGLAGEVMAFVQPLEDLLERATGDPAALYQGSHAWETYAGEAQSASALFAQTAQTIGGQIRGAAAEALQQVFELLSAAVHSLADWAKVISQVLQICVRIVEMLRSLVCAGFELISTFSGAVTELLFGSWPWEVDKKAQVIHEFARNCQEVVAEVTANLDRGLQCLRELVRLLTDLYRALIPFHQALEDRLGQLIQNYPPGRMLGPLGGVPGSLTPGGHGDSYQPSDTPFPGSDQRFREDHDLGYSHSYDLGPTDMTTEELNLMLQQEFGHVFLPSREGENSQLNMQLTGEGQTIHTSLFGMGIPGVTAGDIVVQQITDDGFVIAAAPGHPEYPGEVAFRIRNENGRGVFEITGAYDQTILDSMGFSGNTNPAYAEIADKSIWGDMQYRLEDMMTYGR